MIKNINLPLLDSDIKNLTAGDHVYLSGKMLVLRDAGHKLAFNECLQGNLSLNLKGQTIYYMAPCPAKKGDIIGSCGPTTASRMDKYTPLFHSLGLKATIGKGDRCLEVYEAIKNTNSIYFCAIGGAGALYQECVTYSKVIGYPQLGTEALLEICVRNFPVIVGIDVLGKSIFK